MGLKEKIPGIILIIIGLTMLALFLLLSLGAM
jgi:hypothetical protein